MRRNEIAGSCNKYYTIRAVFVVLCLAGLLVGTEFMPGQPSALFSLLILSVLLIGWVLTRRFRKTF
jgi:hypothetical protein